MNRSHGGWGSNRARLVVPALLLLSSVAWLILAQGHAGGAAAALAVTGLLLTLTALAFAIWVNSRPEPARVVVRKNPVPPYHAAEHPDRPRNSRPRAPGC